MASMENIAARNIPSLITPTRVTGGARGTSHPAEVCRAQTRFVCLLIGVLLSQPVMGQATQREFHTGPDFYSALTVRRAVRWGKIPLRVAADQLSAGSQVAIFIDRRIDPQTEVSLISEQPTFALLDELAQSADLEIAVVDSVIYLAPPGKGDQLGALAFQHQQQRLPAPWRDRRPLNWPRLTAPGDALERLFAQRRVTVDNMEAIPHDLWRETQLPASPLVLQTELIVAGFGLHCHIDATGEASLEPVPAISPFFRQRYAVPQRFRWDESLLELAVGREVLRSDNLQRTRESVTLVGTSWQHAKLRALLLRRSAANPTNPSAGKTQYTLPKTKGSLRRLIPGLAKSLKLQVQLSDQVTDEMLDQVVEFSVTKATRDQLLDALLKDSALEYRIDGSKWIVRPKN